MIFLELFLVFFKIGLFTIGGGYAMIPMMRNELLQRNWVDADTILDFVGIAESTPGPFAINMATFVGFAQAGVGGAAAATLGIILPSFVIMLIVAKLFARFRASNGVQSVFWALKPVVVALVTAATVTLFVQVVLPNIDFKNFSFDTSVTNWVALPIFAIVFAVSRIKIKNKKTHPIFLVLLSAGLGILIYGVIL